MNRADIRILRLKNGDTIIAGFSYNQTTGKVTLERPFQIASIPVMGKKGVKSMSLYLRDWVEYSKDHMFSIPDDVIMLICNPEDELILDYKDAMEQTDLHKVQQDFDAIASNYLGENGDEEDDNPQDMGYNEQTKPNGPKGMPNLPEGFPYPDDDLDDEEEEDEFDRPDRPDD
jgi:hypothetical protein